MRVLSIHDDDDNDNDYRAFCPMMFYRWLIGCCARRCGAVRCLASRNDGGKDVRKHFLFIRHMYEERDRERWSECEHPFNCASM